MKLIVVRLSELRKMTCTVQPTQLTGRFGKLRKIFRKLLLLCKGYVSIRALPVICKYALLLLSSTHNTLLTLLPSLLVDLIQLYRRVTLSLPSPQLHP